MTSGSHSMSRRCCLTCSWGQLAGIKRGRGGAWIHALCQPQPGHQHQKGLPHPLTHCQHIGHLHQRVEEEDTASRHSTHKSTRSSPALGAGKVEADGRKVTIKLNYVNPVPPKTRFHITTFKFMKLLKNTNDPVTASLNLSITRIVRSSCLFHHSLNSQELTRACAPVCG